jgi:hypothetical protein
MPADVPSLFLVCSASADFVDSMADLLSETALPWQELDRTDRLLTDGGACAAVIVDGRNPELTNLVLSLRQQSPWHELPVVMVGGEPRRDLSHVSHLTQAALPQEPETLEWLLRKVVGSRAKLPVSPGTEMRASYRYRSNEPCTVEMDLKLVDISEGGAQLASPFPFKEGTVVRLNLRSLGSDSPLSVSFRILRVRRCERPPSSYRIHGQFVELTSTQHRQIRKVLVRQQFMAAQRVRTLSHI